MGYEVKLKIKELDNKFKPTFRDKPCDEDEIFKQKQIFINYLMIPPEKSEYGLNMNKIFDSFNIYYRIFISYLEENWKYNLQERLKKDDWTEENEIYFCGWEFSDSRCNVNFDNIKEYFFTNLFTLYCVVPTPDYFSDEENFFKKFNVIERLVNELSEQYWDELNKDFVNFYRAKEDTEQDESY